MPSVPEIGQGHGKIRSAEIGRQLKAEQFTNADGNVNSAGKVAVLLERIKEHGGHNDGAAVGAGIGENAIHQKQGPVSDDPFLKESPEHEQKCPLVLVQIKGMLPGKLFPELIKPGNRALNELREKGNEEEIPQRIGLRGIFAVVDVHQVTGGLKSIKRYAQGKEQIKRPEGLMGNGAQEFQKIIGVFKQGQHAEIEKKNRDEDNALLSAAFLLGGFLLFLSEFRPVFLQIVFVLQPDGGNGPGTEPGTHPGDQQEGHGTDAAVSIIGQAGKEQQSLAKTSRAQIIDQGQTDGKGNQGCEGHVRQNLRAILVPAKGRRAYGKAPGS